MEIIKLITVKLNFWNKRKGWKPMVIHTPEDHPCLRYIYPQLWISLIQRCTKNYPMKYFMILIAFSALFGCKTTTGKLQVTVIYSEPKRVTRAVPETGAASAYTTNKVVTKRFDPMVFMLSKNVEKFSFRIQGNISSGGHHSNQVRKIRLEKGKQEGNSITLRYYAEVKKIPGKESANVMGYNYAKDETYEIPDDIKIIRIELYEDRINSTSTKIPRLIAQQTFNFFAKI